MRPVIRLFLILITLTVIVMAWITHQLNSPHIQLLIILLIGVSLAVFFLFNYLDHREERIRQLEKESRPGTEVDPSAPRPKLSDASYSLKEKKSGLTWGGGNIKASEATRGTKRKFLGR
jgi:hypothetical protein